MLATDKEDTVYIYMYTHTHTHTHTHTYIYKGRILLAIENYEILPFAIIWMDLEGIMFSEISEPKKVKYSVITYKWNLKKKPNEYI